MGEITGIVPQAKDKKRCNIFVDGKFCCGLTLEATIKNRLKYGQTITEERLSQIQLESEKETALDKALTHLSATRKTEKQIRQFLKKKGYLETVSNYVVDKLCDYGFLNDGEYAENYVEFAAKKKGEKLIRLELKRKGLSEEDIESALENLDEEEQTAAARTLLDKYMRGKEADVATLQKAFRYLFSKGFDYETVRGVLQAYGECEDE